MPYTAHSDRGPGIPWLGPQSVDTIISDLRIRAIDTVRAAVAIAEHRAAAAHTVGNEAEADRFETEVREAEQRFVRLRGLQDRPEPPRHDYVS
jgi:hypothetical protein